MIVGATPTSLPANNREKTVPVSGDVWYRNYKLGSSLRVKKSLSVVYASLTANPILPRSFDWFCPEATSGEDNALRCMQFIDELHDPTITPAGAIPRAEARGWVHNIVRAKQPTKVVSFTEKQMLEILRFEKTLTVEEGSVIRVRGPTKKLEEWLASEEARQLHMEYIRSIVGWEKPLYGALRAENDTEPRLCHHYDAQKDKDCPVVVASPAKKVPEHEIASRIYTEGVLERIIMREGVFLRRLHRTDNGDCIWEGSGTSPRGPWTCRYLDAPCLALLQTKP